MSTYDGIDVPKRSAHVALKHAGMTVIRQEVKHRLAYEQRTALFFLCPCCGDALFLVALGRLLGGEPPRAGRHAIDVVASVRAPISGASHA